MTTIKDRILIAIPKLPPQNQAKDLQRLTGDDVHNLVHVLYSLNRHGLVGFRLTKQTRQQIPTNIRLTKQGEKYLEKGQ